MDDLQKLSTCGRELRSELARLKDVLEDAEADIIALNIARRLTTVQKKLLEFIRGNLNLILHYCLLDCLEMFHRLRHYMCNYHFIRFVQAQKDSSHTYSGDHGEHRITVKEALCLANPVHFICWDKCFTDEVYSQQGGEGNEGQEHGYQRWVSL